MTYVLYLNLWGTTAKLPSESIPACQTKFAEILTREFKAVEAHVLIDYAYAISGDLEALIEFARETFQLLISVCPAEIWPLRGAISEGLYKITRNDIWVGNGAVRAAEIEKSALKGARLFLDGQIKNPVNSSRDFMVRGNQHREINWMEGWLDESRRGYLLNCCTDLMIEETNYSQQMAASLRDLITWTTDESGGELSKGEPRIGR